MLRGLAVVRKWGRCLPSHSLAVCLYLHTLAYVTKPGGPGRWRFGDGTAPGSPGTYIEGDVTGGAAVIEGGSGRRRRRWESVV
ncbi:hypothetical protein DFH27DRAFT_538644 [Peziza echinospora]|nr:hypothetical protein DFH27DRAFT_538644 [Peziza echinospora]